MPVKIRNGCTVFGSEFLIWCDKSVDMPHV